MAGEFSIRYSTGATLYAIRTRASDGSWWDRVGGAFEAAGTSAWADYAITLTEQGVTGWYLGTDPASGDGGYLVLLQAGGSPAGTDAVVGQGELSAMAANVAAILADTGTDGVVVGSIAPGAITAGSIATSAIDADALAADAVTEIQSGLATAAAVAALPSASAIAAAVWASGTRTLTGFGTLVADIWAGITTAALAKFANTNTGETAAVTGSVAKLSQGDADADAITAAVVAGVTSAAQSDSINTDGTTITRRRGDTWSIEITGLGSLADRDKLWFTLKTKPGLADTASTLQITEAGGLLYLNGAVATSSDATLVVDDEDAGDITITVKAVSTRQVEHRDSYYYDVQVLEGTDVDTKTEGRFDVVSDVTEAVS